MKVTERGVALLMRGMYGAFNSLHLFGVDGEEFNSHGYEPIPLDVNRWDVETGTYGDPEEGVEFTFQAGDPTNVAGYYLTGADGAVILMEELPEPFEVEHRGTKLRVKLKYPFFAGGSEIALQQ